MARALITGISGFAGSHLAEHLLEIGDTVTGLVRGAGTPPNLAAAAGRVALERGDVCDLDALARALDRAAPDHVYHLAGLASPRASFDDPVGCHRVNVLGTAALFEAVRRAGARPRVLLASSAQVYGGRASGPIREDAPLRPTSPYAASKVGAEMIALAAWAAHGIPALCARAFPHFGPRQEALFVAAAFAKQIAAAEAGRAPREVRVGRLTSVRDLADVRDVVRAYRLLAERGAPGEAYNVATGRGTAIRDLLERMVAAARVPLTVVEDAGRLRAGDPDVLVGDPERLERATGYRPSRPLDETIRDVLESWRRRASISGTGG